MTPWPVANGVVVRWQCSRGSKSLIYIGFGVRGNGGSGIATHIYTTLYICTYIYSSFSLNDLEIDCHFCHHEGSATATTPPLD